MSRCPAYPETVDQRAAGLSRITTFALDVLARLSKAEPSPFSIGPRTLIADKLLIDHSYSDFCSSRRPQKHSENHQTKSQTMLRRTNNSTIKMP